MYEKRIKAIEEALSHINDVEGYGLKEFMDRENAPKQDKEIEATPGKDPEMKESGPGKEETPNQAEKKSPYSNEDKLMVSGEGEPKKEEDEEEMSDEDMRDLMDEYMK